MQLQDISFAGQRLIEAYGDGGFRLSDGRHEGSIILLPGSVELFSATIPDDLKLDLFEPIFATRDDVEIMILGTGKTQQFPAAEITRAFLEHNIALETMDTSAACRTFNILVSEDRRVAAALIAV